MAKGPTMKALEARLENVLREIEKLQAQADLLRDMMREARGEPKTKARAPRSNVKQTVLTLLEEVGAGGLNGSMAVDLAEKQGTTLERATVSSLLSRLKNEGIVSYDGKLYRLEKYRSDNGLNIHPLRTSGAL